MTAHELGKILLHEPDHPVRLVIGNPKDNLYADPVAGIAVKVRVTEHAKISVVEVEGWASDTKLYIEQKVDV